MATILSQMIDKLPKYAVQSYCSYNPSAPNLKSALSSRQAITNKTTTRPENVTNQTAHSEVPHLVHLFESPLRIYFLHLS